MHKLATLQNQTISLLTKTFMDVFSVEMRRRRKIMGLSLENLSQKSGVSKTFLFNLENGHAPNVSVYTLIQISKTINYYQWMLPLLTKSGGVKTKNRLFIQLKLFEKKSQTNDSD